MTRSFYAARLYKLEVAVSTDRAIVMAAGALSRLRRDTGAAVAGEA